MAVLKFLWNHFLKRVINEERGTWGMVASAVITTGGAYAMNQSGGDDDDGGEFQYPAEFPEAEGARGEWWNRLQEWGEQPGYGAISPEWGDIWERAKGKIDRYYWGGPGETGQAGKIRASAARRNVAQGPQVEAELTKMGQQQGLQLGDLATGMATQEAEFGERGRMNWLQSLQSLSGLQRVSQYIPPEQDNTSGMMGELGGAAMSIYGQKQNQAWQAEQQQQQRDWWTDMMKPQKTQSSITWEAF